MGTEPSAPGALHLSEVIRGSLLDEDGARLGRVDDLVVRLGDDEHPPVSGALAKVAGREVWVPAEEIQSIEPGRIRLARALLDLRRFDRRPQEVLLKADVLDRQVINVEGANLVRANEIELARADGWYRVVGVDVGTRGFVRRLLPRPLARLVSSGSFVDWRDIEPFFDHVPTLRLRVLHPKLVRLHPAEIADLVEAASHREAREILAAVGDDHDREADVLEELSSERRLQHVVHRSDAEIADLLQRMEPDDAADLVGSLPHERRAPVLSLLPSPLQRHLRALLGYDPATAGGLMTPEFVCLYANATREEALARVGESPYAPESLNFVYLMSAHDRFRGAIALPDLVRAEPGTLLEEIPPSPVVVLEPAAGFDQIARVMSDYDLTAVPVVEDAQRLIGIVTVDDVLEVMLPAPRSGPFGLLRTG